MRFFYIGLVVVLLAAAGWLFCSSREEGSPEGSSEVSPSIEEISVGEGPAPVGAGKQDLEPQVTAPSLPSKGTAAEEASAVRGSSGFVAIVDEPGFRETRIYQAWRSRGTTDEDIREAVRRMAAEGASPDELRDPNLIIPYLPERNIRPIYFETVELPQVAGADQPIPFSIQAHFPDPSYSFSEWKIEVEAGRVTVEPLGDKSGKVVAAVEVPTEVEGSIPGLAAGEYTVVFEGIGTPVEYMLSVQ